MADELTVICPNCDAHVATVPRGYVFKEPLICPHCGEALEPDDLIDRLARDAMEALKRIRDKFK